MNLESVPIRAPLLLPGEGLGPWSFLRWDFGVAWLMPFCPWDGVLGDPLGLSAPFVASLCFSMWILQSLFTRVPSSGFRLVTPPGPRARAACVCSQITAPESPPASSLNLQVSYVMWQKGFCRRN